MKKASGHKKTSKKPIDSIQEQKYSRKRQMSSLSLYLLCVLYIFTNM